MDGLLRGTLSGEEDTLAAGTLYGSVVVDAGDLSALASWAHTAGLVSGDLVDRVAGRALMTARVNGDIGVACRVWTGRWFLAHVGGCWPDGAAGPAHGQPGAFVT